MTTLLFQSDVQGNNAYAPYTADDKWRASLTNGNQTNFVVPNTSDKWVAAFAYQPGTTVWVDLTGAAATLPASATLTPTTAELLPGQRQVKAGDTISMITPNATAEVEVVLYAVP